MATSLGDFYANVMARGGVVPSAFSDGDKGRCRLLLAWCNAMATTDEQRLLKPAKAGTVLPDAGARRTAALRIHKLVVARLCDFYDSPKDVPRELGKGNLSCSSLENRVRPLAAKEKLSPKDFTAAVAKASLFAEWRKAYEEKDAQQAAEVQQPAAKKRKEGGSPH